MSTVSSSVSRSRFNLTIPRTYSRSQRFSPRRVVSIQWKSEAKQPRDVRDKVCSRQWAVHSMPPKWNNPAHSIRQRVCQQYFEWTKIVISSWSSQWHFKSRSELLRFNSCWQFYFLLSHSSHLFCSKIF